MIERSARPRVVQRGALHAEILFHVHGSSIVQHAVAEAPFDVTHGDRTATVARWMRNIDPPPFWAGQLGKPGKVDRWQIIRFEAPCTIAIDVGGGAHRHRRTRGRSLAGRQGYVLNSITPETDWETGSIRTRARVHPRAIIMPGRRGNVGQQSARRTQSRIARHRRRNAYGKYSRPPIPAR